MSKLVCNKSTNKENAANIICTTTKSNAKIGGRSTLQPCRTEHKTFFKVYFTTKSYLLCPSLNTLENLNT